MAKSTDQGVGSSSMDILNAIKIIQTMLADASHISGGLVIGTTTTKVRTGAAIKYMVNGVLCTKAITDDAFTLAGTVVNATFNVFVMTINAAGTCTARMGTAGATLAAVVFPVIPSGEVVIGYVIVNPTGTGNFVGGTTAMADGTVVPNAVYMNTPFPFNPLILALPNGY